MKSTKIDYLNGLKGIACLIVACNHSAGAFFNSSQSEWKSFPFAIFFNGTFMVSLFFLLSSFFVAFSFLKKGSSEKLGQSLFLRSMRLVFPIFFVSLFIWIFMNLGLYSVWQPMKEIIGSIRKDADAMNYHTVYPIWDVLINSIKVIWVSSTKFTFVLWMIEWLYKGCFVAAIMALIFNRLKTLPAFITIFAADLVLKYYVGSRYRVFAWGVFLAYLFLRKQEWFHSRVAKVFSIPALVVVFWFGNYWPNTEMNGIYVPLRLFTYEDLFLYASVLLVLSIFSLQSLQILLSTRTMCFLGNISFAVYLVHEPLQIIVGGRVFLLLYGILGNVQLSVFAAFLISLIFILGAAYLFHRYIEPLCQKASSWIAEHCFISV